MLFLSGLRVCLGIDILLVGGLLLYNNLTYSICVFAVGVSNMVHTTWDIQRYAGTLIIPRPRTKIESSRSRDQVKTLQGPYDRSNFWIII